MGRSCFKLKKNWFEHMLKYKAIWVAHSYKQEKKLDFVEIFTTVVEPMSYKCFFAVGVKRGYWICHIDIVTAFFYNFLDKVIYWEQFHLFVTKLDKVCKLIKDFCRLEQAPHVW